MRVRNLRTTMLGVLCAGAIACPAFGDPYDYTWDHPCPDPQELTCEPFTQPPVCWCEADWDDADNWIGDGYPSDPSDTAMIEHSNTGHCDGGANDGDPCSEAGDCPDACVGGLNHGDECNDDVDCPGTCDVGERAGQACNSDSDCPGTCVGGLRDGKPCWAQDQCPFPGTCENMGTCQNKGTCENVGTCQNYEDRLVISVVDEQIFRLDIESACTNATEDEFDLRFDSSSTQTLSVGRLEIDAECGPVTVRALGNATLEAY
jgi:hypothetical protein